MLQLLYNNEIIDINLSSFPDGTPLLKSISSEFSPIKIVWRYENDSEMFNLYCLVRDLQDKGVSGISLYLPYIPNARMDRVKNESDVFTLKYFTEFLNSMKFTHVYVFDAHSDVSVAMINNCINESPVTIIKDVLNRLDFNAATDFIVYPDAGCKKRLEDKIIFPSVFGNKVREWSTGKILGIEIYGADLNRLKGARVLFVDDICSYGGTAKYTLEKLKEFGVSECYCFFSHVEKSIFGKEGWNKTGEGVPTLLSSGLADCIFCTNSIFFGDDIEEKKKLFDVPFAVIPLY